MMGALNAFKLPLQKNAVAEATEGYCPNFSCQKSELASTECCPRQIFELLPLASVE
jgi:hypothetical protein